MSVVPLAAHLGVFTAEDGMNRDFECAPLLPFFVLFKRYSHDNLLPCVTCLCQNAAELKPPRSYWDKNEHEFHKSPTVHIHLHFSPDVNQRSRACPAQIKMQWFFFVLFCFLKFLHCFHSAVRKKKKKKHLLHRAIIILDLSLNSSMVWESTAQ